MNFSPVSVKKKHHFIQLSVKKPEDWKIRNKHPEKRTLAGQKRGPAETGKAW